MASGYLGIGARRKEFKTEETREVLILFTQVQQLKYQILNKIAVCHQYLATLCDGIQVHSALYLRGEVGLISCTGPK